MERYQYDALHQLIRMDEYALNGKQKTYTEYTYDAAGNRTSDCNRVPTTPTVNYAYTGNKGTWGGEWNTYTYDALNRLVKEYEQDTALAITYAYDSLGNKTYEKNSQDEKRYTYNAMNQLVTKEAYNRTTNYVYDKRGNRTLESSIHTQENRRTYQWDETGRLVKGTRGPDYGLYTSEYTYNGLGIRVNSTIMGPDKTIYDRDYVIDYTSPERNDLAEFNLGHYQWQGDKKVHDLTHLYNGAGQRLQTESVRYVDWAGEKHYTRYIHEDIMGSSYYYTNPENGYVTNQHEYTTWGNNTKAPTYNYDPEYRASEPYFTGHPYDGSLNLYYAENRFYDPETGSFLSSDPAKSGLNWYQYCNSNPVTYVDPLGLYPTTIREDDPFFFKKMQDSGGEISALLNEIDSITLDEFISINMGSKEAWREQQLLTAKYLTFFMLTDPFFTEREYGREMMYAVIGNMFCEAFPGKTEQYIYDETKKFNDIFNNKNSNYMQATLQETAYRDITDQCGGWANRIAIIQKLYQLPNRDYSPNKEDFTVSLKNGDVVYRQGFGFGMLQYTFSRATSVMEVYLDLYSCCKDELTMGQCFAAEYQLLRNELGDKKSTYSFEALIKGSEKNPGNTIVERLGYTFRDVYENPGDNSQDKGGARAEKWYQLINYRINEALE